MMATSLGWARLTSGKDEVIFVTENGQALRFSESKIRSMGRQAAGVQAIRLANDDQVTSMDVVEKDGSLLVITTSGYGKQTPLSAYTPKGRATSGISTIDQKALDEIGKIVAARVVQKADDLTIITSNGVAIRIKNKDVKQAGRSTKGVHLIKPQPGDSVASVARIAAEDLKKAGADTECRGEDRSPTTVDINKKDGLKNPSFFMCGVFARKPILPVTTIASTPITQTVNSSMTERRNRCWAVMPRNRTLRLRGLLRRVATRGWSGAAGSLYRSFGSSS